MKIFYSKEVHEIDAYTVKNEPIKSIDLMERAGSQLTNWILSNFDNNEYSVIVGAGNNGGDGLVIARLLTEAKKIVHVCVVKISSDLSPNLSVNLERLKKYTQCSIQYITNENEIPDFVNCGVLIDAIFGSGLTRSVKDLASSVIEKMNQSKAKIIAVDIPSGLLGEDNSENDGSIINANVTLTLQFPNLSFFYSENEIYFGEWHIIPIGLHPDIIESKETVNYFIEADNITQKLINRKKFSHKGTFGHALLIAGNYGKMGASILSAKACLRSGIGLITVHIPKSGYEILQTAVPEAMVCIDESENVFCQKDELQKYTAIGIGPGIGQKKAIQFALKEILQNSNSPLVLDADALNILSKNKDWLELIPENSILTPHPKEFERLAGISTNGYVRNQMQINFAKKYNVYIILKGANTSIACPNGNCYFNSTGNPGMATAGSGDVLTGIILSLLAQGYHSKYAALISVYLHGLAADLALQKQSQQSLIATDIIKYLGKAFKYLQKEK